MGRAETAVNEEIDHLKEDFDNINESNGDSLSR